MQKLLLFDFDGVITNTLDMILDVKHDLNQTISKEDYLKLFHGNIFDSIEKQKERTYTKNDQDSFAALYGPRLLESEPIEGIVELIKRLAQDYRLVIVSSTTNQPIEQYLAKLDVLECFDGIFGGDISRSKVEKINTVLEKFNGSPEHSIYVTDTLGDIIEARKANVDSISVTWGFHDRDTLLQGKPKYVVDSIAELENTLATIFNS